MIERKFVNQHIKEFEIKEYVRDNLSRVGLSDVKLQRTPLGEKIIISTSRPGLVVGRSGSNISKLTKDLKEKFSLENPQIEIEEVVSVGLDANIIAEMIVNSLERFGLARFKGVGHKALSDVMAAGAFGVEILISGKIPSARARTWRFYQGYLKKCGDIAVSEVKTAYAHAKLKTGVVGVRVKIMTPDIKLPDNIKIKKIADEASVEEVSNEQVDEKMKDILKEEGEDKKDRKESTPKKKASKKDASDKEKKPRKPRSKKVKKTDKAEESEEEKTAEIAETVEPKEAEEPVQKVSETSEEEKKEE
ncbi:30S ribosomal protein S3 [Candidatus Woesearchaeota archaeon]|nr:30S ribosomal protein S3 [Candidatus Woesearchaeota archaeon]